VGRASTFGVTPVAVFGAAVCDVARGQRRRRAGGIRRSGGVGPLVRRPDPSLGRRRGHGL